jgi:hypothetical protein
MGRKIMDNRFKPQGSGQSAQDVLKLTAGGWEGPVLQKDRIEADPAPAKSQSTDGDVFDLARKIARVFRQAIAPATGVTSLTVTERKALRDRIVTAMTQEQDGPTTTHLPIG